MDVVENMIYIVTGIPRSGTSMMMQILEAGGVSVLKDDRARTPDYHNPHGYYEIHNVQAHLSSANNLKEMDDKNQAVKMFAGYLDYVPWRWRKCVKIIWMGRDPECIKASHNKLMTYRAPEWMKDHGDNIVNDFMEAWGDDIRRARTQLHTFHSYIAIGYEETLSYPKRSIGRLSTFLKHPKFNVDEAVTAVDPACWRNKP